uniref:Protein FAM136A n=1 Tax=Parastrongyloides trichosuri TaxID=131310 RepID=A0A0N4Z777_PARTI
MEQAQKRMTNAVEEFVEDIDRKYIRSIQRKMFDCSSRCVNDTQSRRVEIEGCINSCNSGMISAQNYLQKELTTLQDQLSRCAMSAYDKAIQKYGEPKNDEEVKKVQKMLDEQLPTCVSDHIGLLPKIEKRFLSEVFNKLK